MNHSMVPSELGQTKEPSFKDGYNDMLYEWKTFLDLAYVLKSRRDVKVYKYNVHRGYDDLKRDVLGSDRVRKTIEKLCEGDKTREEELERDGDEIYTGMAHLLNDNGTRLMAFGIIKVFRAIYKRIYINEEAIERLRQLMYDHPVILMPSHRSYMDFILVSYVCFQYNLPLPAIAAAMDFKGMKLMGWMLQNSGAFYIRRSFGSDQLYWAIFSEYVQTQLRNGDHPLEFFIEGTRSRTNKSYVPKIGMLSTSLESYFKAQVPDILIVPISISFERNLEEVLYSYELLGIPKPKETTKGLLKARSILSEDYGTVHVHIGEHISVHEFSRGRIDRISHATQPVFMSSLRADEKVLIKDIAYQVVKQQQRHFVIGAGVLVSTVMCQHKQGLLLPDLASEVDWLRKQAVTMGAYVDWPDGMGVIEVVKLKLRLYKNILTINDDGLVTIVSPSSPPSSSPPSSSPTSLTTSSSRRTDLFSQASTQLVLSSYRNCLCHLFIEVAIVVMVLKTKLKTGSHVNLEEIFSEYSFLETLLSRDFIFETKKTRQSFNKALDFLQKCHFVRFSDHLHQDNCMYSDKNDNETTKDNYNDTRNNNETNDTRDNNETNDTRNNNETNDTRDNNETNDTRYNNETNDTRDNNETNDNYKEVQNNNDTNPTMTYDKNIHNSFSLSINKNHTTVFNQSTTSSQSTTSNHTNHNMETPLPPPTTTVELDQQCFFFPRIFQPFLFTYWFVTSSLRQALTSPMTEKQLALKLQDLALSAIEEKATYVYETLSLELINNVLSSLLDANAIVKDNRDDVITANLPVILILTCKIRVYVEGGGWIAGKVAPVTTSKL